MSLRHAILGILDRNPMHGYELKRVLDQHVSLFWPVKLAAIYPSLHRLEEDGLVTHRTQATPEGRPDRKVYSITGVGRDELRRWCHEPPEGQAENRSPLYLKLLVAREEHFPDAIHWVQKELDEFRARLERVPRVDLPDKPEFLLPRFMRDSGVAHIELQIELLESLQERLLRHCTGRDQDRGLGRAGRRDPENAS